MSISSFSRRNSRRNSIGWPGSGDHRWPSIGLGLKRNKVTNELPVSVERISLRKVQVHGHSKCRVRMMNLKMRMLLLDGRRRRCRRCDGAGRVVSGQFRCGNQSGRMSRLQHSLTETTQIGQPPPLPSGRKKMAAVDDFPLSADQRHDVLMQTTRRLFEHSVTSQSRRYTDTVTNAESSGGPGYNQQSSRQRHTWSNRVANRRLTDCSDLRPHRL